MSNVSLNLVCFSDITVYGHARNLDTKTLREATGVRNHLFSSYQKNKNIFYFILLPYSVQYLRTYINTGSRIVVFSLP